MRRQDIQRPTNRLIGEFVSDIPGPTLVVIGSLHGNEPAGVAALQRVMERLRETPQAVKSGTFKAFVGNMAALSANRRFLERDLNRNWSRRLSDFTHTQATVPVEDREQKELLALIEETVRSARGDVFVLDLHTTSGDSPPFTVFADTLKSRGFARQLPNPIILGLEEHLEGTMVDFLATRGYAAIAVEGGQHGDALSVDRLEAIVWIALDYLHIATVKESLTKGRRALVAARGDTPRALEITARHAVHPDDRFKMHPGFRGFDRVRSGQILAVDRHGAIHAPADGLLLMPLYQELGDDGFFVVRPVWRAWLILSRILRALRSDRVVHWLPGVSRVEGQPGVYRVNRRVARFFAIQILHLLGFKKVGEGKELFVARRIADQA